MDPQALLQMIMGQQAPVAQTPADNQSQKPGPAARGDAPYDASHPLWEEATAIFEEQYGHSPATDSDMEVTMQEIMAQLEQSNTGAAQPKPPASMQDQLLDMIMNGQGQ